MGAGWEWHGIVKISLYTPRVHIRPSHQFQRLLPLNIPSLSRQRCFYQDWVLAGNHGFFFYNFSNV
jgi:hypothetical protein